MSYKKFYFYDLTMWIHQINSMANKDAVLYLELPRQNELSSTCTVNPF